MTHEFKEIIHAYKQAKEQGIPAVIATVVDVKGSSYRRSGVQMLLLGDGTMVGAVSGGCVEKEVARQSSSVFDTKIPKIMTYDGQYRLGCEGILYILIEELELTDIQLEKLALTLENRVAFKILSSYSNNKSEIAGIGSSIYLQTGEIIPFSKTQLSSIITLDTCHILMNPCFQLIIIGAEHDAVRLCELAAISGWEVTVIASPKDPKLLKDFLGAKEIIHCTPENLLLNTLDKESAVVLMTHNFAKDLLYLQAIKNEYPAYIGLLGPAKRREKLLNAFIEYFPEVHEDFLDLIHGPAGLNLGAETPQEIAISILAEILSVIRVQKPIPLQDKEGAIHTISDVVKQEIYVDTDRS